jgi:CheY-like chemotaxis protein
MALIMVADDDVALTEVLKDFLQSLTHQVVVVHDGTGATLKAQEWKPHLIIMDIMMPGVYGTSAYKALDQAGVAAKVPFIFITSLAPEKVKPLLPQNATTRFLPKPIDFGALETAVNELLAAKK